MTGLTKVVFKSNTDDGFYMKDINHSHIVVMDEPMTQSFGRIYTRRTISDGSGVVNTHKTTQEPINIDATFFDMSVIMCYLNTKYWNRNCVGQAALAIVEENGALKTQYEQYQNDKCILQKDREILQRDREELQRDKEALERQKVNLLVESGMAKIQEDREELQTMRSKYLADEKVLNEEKDKLGQIKEQLSNITATIQSDKRRLETDMEAFKTYKQSCITDIDKIWEDLSSSKPFAPKDPVS
jgi:hypothetical protein